MNDKIIIIKQEPRISKNYRVTAKNIAFLQKVASKKKANVSDIINAILDNARIGHATLRVKGDVQTKSFITTGVAYERNN